MEEVLEAVALGGVDNDMEYFTLHNVLVDRNNVMQRPVFNLEDIEDEAIRLKFRFLRADIIRLAHILRISNEVITIARNKTSGK